MKRNILALSAIFCIGFSSPSIAQEVYRCGYGRSVLYTEKPCAGRVVNTDPAAARAKPRAKRSDLRRSEENRALARSMRRRAGESAEQFETRRRRARLLQEDRAECGRLDTRIPVEEASLNNPDRDEVARAEAALGDSRKRFRELRC